MPFMEHTYTKSHMTKVMGLDTLTCITGLLLAVSPFAMHNFPADIDTTAHVALGMLIAAPAAFRVLVAYSSLWVEVVEMALAVIVLSLPTIMHQHWDPKYTNAHYAAGGAILVLSLISLVVTLPVTKK